MLIILKNEWKQFSRGTCYKKVCLIAFVVMLMTFALSACSVSDDEEDLGAEGEGEGEGECEGEICGDECVNTQTNSEHCGGCNNACPDGTTCEEGKCMCSGGLTYCDGVIDEELADDLYENNDTCGTTRTRLRGCDICLLDSFYRDITLSTIRKALTKWRGLSYTWCPGTELNCRHEDFQSPALPTELPGHSDR